MYTILKTLSKQPNCVLNDLIVQDMIGVYHVKQTNASHEDRAVLRNK